MKSIHKPIHAAAKRVRRSEANHNIWLVGSGNPKTHSRFYSVRFDEELDAFICDCAAFTLKMTIPCCHILTCCVKEGGKA